MSRSGNPLIWDYFKKNSYDKIAECNICKKNISYKTTITNLKQHLKLKHISDFNEFTSRCLTHHRNSEVPSSSASDGDFNDFTNKQQNFVEGFQVSDDEEEDSKNCYTEFVYIEDDEAKEVIPKAKSPVPFKVIKLQKQPVPKARVDNEEEIENFGRYIIGLMKTVPDEVCTKLQMDIVSLIMTAKLNAQNARSNAYLTPVNMAENETINHS